MGDVWKKEAEQTDGDLDTTSTRSVIAAKAPAFKVDFAAISSFCGRSA
jgi:hypothetical protein